MSGCPYVGKCDTLSVAPASKGHPERSEGPTHRTSPPHIANFPTRIDFAAAALALRYSPQPPSHL